MSDYFFIDLLRRVLLTRYKLSQPQAKHVDILLLVLKGNTSISWQCVTNNWKILKSARYMANVTNVSVPQLVVGR